MSHKQNTLMGLGHSWISSQQAHTSQSSNNDHMAPGHTIDFLLKMPTCFSGWNRDVSSIYLNRMNEGHSINMDRENEGHSIYMNRDDT